MNLHDDVSAEQIHEHIRAISKLSFSGYSLALRVEIGVHPDLVCGNKIGYKLHKSFPRPGIELSYTLKSLEIKEHAGCLFLVCETNRVGALYFNEVTFFCRV